MTTDIDRIIDDLHEYRLKAIGPNGEFLAEYCEKLKTIQEQYKNRIVDYSSKTLPNRN